MQNDEDTLIRHIKRTPGPELIEKWKTKGIHVPQAYFIEFLEFDRFCQEHGWTFSEGLVYMGEASIFEKKIKLDEEYNKMQGFK